MTIYTHLTHPKLEADLHQSEAIEEASKAAVAITSFERPNGPDVDYYLQVGRFLYVERQKFRSTKLFGQHFARVAPAVYEIDAYLRSDSKWLFMALQGIADGDILEVLGVTDIRCFCSSNPSVIRRAYRKACKART